VYAPGRVSDRGHLAKRDRQYAMRRTDSRFRLRRHVGSRSYVSGVGFSSTVVRDFAPPPIPMMLREGVVLTRWLPGGTDGKGI
jgi:hypothetical protein